MKKIGFCFFMLFAIIACSPSADEVKEQCLKDTETQIFYKEQTASYCDCVYEKLKEIQASTKLTDEVVDSVKADCDAEYTSFDTNF